jgi:hypothetical protein
VSSLEQVPLMIKRALITEKSKLMVVLSSIMSTVLIGCSMVTATVPDDIKTLYPSNIPKGTSTNFGSALACMDFFAGLGQLHFRSDFVCRWDRDANYCFVEAVDPK